MKKLFSASVLLIIMTLALMSFDKKSNNYWHTITNGCWSNGQYSLTVENGSFGTAFITIGAVTTQVEITSTTQVISVAQPLQNTPVIGSIVFSDQMLVTFTTGTNSCTLPVKFVEFKATIKKY